MRPRGSRTGISSSVASVGLDPDQRAVLVLHYYVGMSVPMVAETLGVPLGTAQSRLGRALAALRTTLGPEFDTEHEPLQRGGIA